MKIKKAIAIHSLTISTTTAISSSFFAAASEETLYFKSLQEATLYREKYHPQATLRKKVMIAIIDQDKEGNPHCIAVRKVEDMLYSNNNKETSSADYCRHSIYFAATPALERAMKENASSVFVVKEVTREEAEESSSELGDPSSTTIFYDCADVVDKETRFLLVTKKGRWFVERGEEIKLTDASDLVLAEEERQKSDKLIAQLQREDELLRWKGEKWWSTPSSFGF